jgi:hypothetical protein
MVPVYFSFELCVKSLRALREPFNNGEHKGFFTERAKRGGEFLTAEDAEVTELDGEEWFSAVFSSRTLREPLRALRETFLLIC